MSSREQQDCCKSGCSSVTSNRDDVQIHTDTPTADVASTNSSLAPTVKPRRLKAQFRPSSSSSSMPNTHTPHGIPMSITHNHLLNHSIAQSLPSHYNFEIHKTLHRIQQLQAKRVALQMPEGLLVYACVIADILSQYGHVDCVIMGDVTYGACCVDDFTARALQCDLLVHYAHSCLIPTDVTQLATLYVFVDIHIDTQHVIQTLTTHFPPDTRLILAGTIQFAASLQHITPALLQHFPHVHIPQSKPLSKGEVLGCTSPVFGPEYDTVVFIADGRFHLESMMIQNPHVKHFYKYDPYTWKITLEQYNHTAMHQLRQSAIATATDARHWGLILGTLGRQGNPQLLARLSALLTTRHIPFTLIALSEISPQKLSLLPDIDCFVQIACPRLSIDWGAAFAVPLLNTYEAEVCLQQIQWQTVYPMDYYAEDGGAWSNYAAKRQERLKEKEQRDKERNEREEKRRVARQQKQQQLATTASVQESVLHARPRQQHRAGLIMVEEDD